MHVHSGDLRRLLEVPFDRDHRAELTRRLVGVFSTDPCAPHLERLLDAALGEPDPSIVDLAGNPEDRGFLDSLIRTRLASSDGPGRGLRRHRSTLTVGRDADYLADLPAEWSLCHTLNHLGLAGLQPRRRVALLTSVRNEGINLLEWLAHYRVLGVSSFLIYKNDNDDGSDVLLDRLAQAGVLTVIQNEVALTGVDTIQRKVFEHALGFMPELWDHEWMLFVDPDEFLMLAQGGLDSLLDSMDERQASTGGGVGGTPHDGGRPSGLAFHWKWFGSHRELRRGPGLTLERYTRSRPSPHVKTLARIREVTGFRTAHYPRLLDGGFLCDAAGHAIADPWQGIGPEYALGQVNHYWNKSFEEFLAKSRRGNGDRAFKLFFEWGNRDPADPGEPDPLPSGWLARVRIELETLSSIPGVRECAAALERRFDETLTAYDREHSLQRLYEQARMDFERDNPADAVSR